MLPFEQGLFDADQDARHGPVHRTWPGAPEKRMPPGAEQPRWLQVQNTIREASYKDGERAGIRAGYWWGFAAGAAIGGVVVAAVFSVCLALGYAS